MYILNQFGTSLNHTALSIQDADSWAERLLRTTSYLQELRIVNDRGALMATYSRDIRNPNCLHVDLTECAS